jgi:UDP-glucose 4-epimerase
MNRIVVIGSTGFIGNSFLARASMTHECLPLSSSDVDLCQEQAHLKLAELLKEDDHVFFLSALKKDSGNNFNLYQKNTLMAQQVAEALKIKKPKSLIFLSSAAVYGEEVHNTNITEETTPCPTSYYGLSKFDSEKILDFERDSSSSYPLIKLRPPTVYGANDTGESYGPAGFLKKAIRNDSITTWGDGSELREFLYIEDLVELMLHSLNIDGDKTLNIVAGKSYCFRDVLTFLEGKHSLELDKRERSKSKVDNAFKNDELKKVCPNFTFTPLELGLEKMYQDLTSK